MSGQNCDTYTNDTCWLTIEPATIIPGRIGALSREQARIWALVLDSQGLPCCLEKTDSGYGLTTRAETYDQVCRELIAFERKNQNWPPQAPLVKPLAENSLATISILLLLATFHNVVQLDSFAVSTSYPDWIDAGNAQAGKILNGEWWRLITALTLHADWAHLSANLGVGGIFVLLLCRELGSGLGWSLMLGAGACGNLVNAFVQPESHHSVGASTAVFGAVGILAAISYARRKREQRQRWTLPVAAALALLAILGTEGKNTDLGAHLFGFISGLALGTVAEQLINRYGSPKRLPGFLMALGSMGAVLFAWWLALTTL